MGLRIGDEIIEVWGPSFDQDTGTSASVKHYPRVYPYPDEQAAPRQHVPHQQAHLDVGGAGGAGGSDPMFESNQIDAVIAGVQAAGCEAALVIRRPSDGKLHKLRNRSTFVKDLGLTIEVTKGGYGDRFVYFSWVCV
jgi:hypothetical protein